MASGDTLAIFTAHNASFPASNPALPDERGADHKIIKFDDTTNQTVYFKFKMPQNYGGGGVKVLIQWLAASAVADTVDWDAAFERLAANDQDYDSSGFAAVNSADNETTNGTAGKATVSEITFTDGADMDSVGAGDGFRLATTRDAVSDDMSGNAEIDTVEIREV